MKRILHIVTDDKFGKFVYQEFSQTENVTNEYLFISESEQPVFINFPYQHYWNGADIYLERLMEAINRYQIVVIHFLNKNARRIISKLNPEIKVVWIGWGGDYYWLIDTLPKFSLYGRQTAKYLNAKNSYFTRKLKKISRILKVKALQRIDYFSPVLESEYDMIKINYPNFRPNYIAWNYGNLQDNYIAGYEDFKITDKNLLIGNSATPTNNHLDIFERLENGNTINFFDKIFIPLSYGNKDYKKFIIEQSETRLGNKVNVIPDFLPYEQYMEILQQCDNVIMGHIRQQAMGNIIALLYLGAKIYFQKESVVYKDLISKGYNVFTIADLKDENLVKNPLNSNIIAVHRELLNAEWGKKSNSLNTQNICSL
ncbi:TDP-N-acetylfucosamine:lipid II N-acetylfucosaminyltransferase [Chryseobacterium sp. KACC 21268]|nr:TDP-N-acetylfucosamine:lipid II N-acetylfucosaminyltransferase [Chryseobacterium sp. KACC 21268]